MKLYATVSSERATKGQGGNEYLDITITGAYETELVVLRLVPNGANYLLTGWTHDNHRILHDISENMTKGKQQKDEDPVCKHGVNLKYNDCHNCDKGQ